MVLPTSKPTPGPMHVFSVVLRKRMISLYTRRSGVSSRSLQIASIERYGNGRRRRLTSTRPPASTLAIESPSSMMRGYPCVAFIRSAFLRTDRRGRLRSRIVYITDKKAGEDGDRGSCRGGPSGPSPPESVGAPYRQQPDFI